MPRAENYYDKVLEKEPVQAEQVVSDYPTYQDPDVFTPAEKQARKYKIEAGESVLDRLPGEIKETVGRTIRDYKTVFKGTSEAIGLELSKRLAGAPQGATNFDYVKMGAEDAAKTAWHLAKAIPKEIIKAPFRMSHSMLEAENRFISKKLGVESTMPVSYDIPILGEVKSLGGAYDDDIKNGMSPATAGINTTVRFVGDAAVAFLGMDISRSLFRPSVKVVKTGTPTKNGKPVFKELPPEQKLQATAEYKKVEAQFSQKKFTKQTGPDTSTGEMFISKQNPNVAYRPLTKEGLERAGLRGTPQDFLWRLTLDSKGAAIDHHIVKLLGSPYERIKTGFRKKLDGMFGKSRVIEGEFGPEVVVKSLKVRVGEKGILGEAPITKAPAVGEVAVENTRYYQMYSPNIDTATTFERAVKNLDSPRHANIKSIATDINKECGLNGKIKNTIGDTKSYGVENALSEQGTIIDDLVGRATVRVASAKKGLAGNQISTLNFIENIKGKDNLYVISHEKNNVELRKILDDNGIEFRTLDEGTFLVYDEGKVISNKIENVNKQINGKFETVAGEGEFIGGETRAEGLQSYKKIIKESKVLDDSGLPKAKIEPAITEKVSEAGFVADAEKLGVAPAEVPSVMKRPIEDFENKLVTGKQVEQIQHLQTEKNIDAESVQSISTLLNGKANLNELTQNEAFAISETLRGIPAEGKAEVFDFNTNLNKSWTHQARRWMESVERESKMAGKNFPVLSEVYVPMELGIRMRDGAFMRMQTRFREVFGKYSGNKYLEERRMIEEYRTGNTDVITKNEKLTPEVKEDLIEIAEWQRKWYNAAFKDVEVGITSERWFNHYGPQIRESGGIKYMYKEDSLPKELNTFFKFEREGMLAPYMDDSLALMEIYARAFSGQKFVKPAYDHAQKVIDKLPPNIQKATRDYAQEKMGYKEDLEKALIDYGKKLSKKRIFGKSIFPENITRQTIDFGMTNSYAAALGIPRLMPIVRNMMQYPLMTISDLGMKYGMYGWKRAFKKGEIEKIRRRGILVQSGVEYGGELAEATGRGIVGKAADKYKKFGQALMKPYGGVDSVNRTGTVIGVEKRFDDHWNLFSNGKISYQEFERGIDMQGFSPTIQQMLRKRFSKGDKISIEEANDIMVLDIVDRTQFPYRRGTQTRMHYGLKGKAGLQFSQWIWEYAFTMKDWVARGQWDKILRFLGTGTTIKRVAEEDFGIDVEKWVMLGPFSGFPLGPIASMAISTSDAIKNSLTGMDKEFNENYQAITGSLKLYGGPAFGVGKQRLDRFFESVQRHEAGLAPSPDPEKPFWIISSTGKAMRPVSFTELLMDTFGFASMEGSEQSDRINRIKRDEIEKGMKVDKAMKYLVNSGDWEGFNEMVVKDNIMISDIAMKMRSYNIPLDDRIYERLPIELKIKYLNLFYPSED